jgi:cold shock CspA family protein
MADTRCTISLVVNGQRWLEEGEALAATPGVPRAWSLCGLQDHVRVSIGAKLGFSFENIDFGEQRWCRAKSNTADAEAVAAGFTVVSTPHVAATDPGAGLSLEAVEMAAIAPPDVIVTVGSQLQWLPMRQKLEAGGIHVFELLLPPTGKVVVATERVIDLRDLARQHHGNDRGRALFRPAPVTEKANPSASASQANSGNASDINLAANAARGSVKSLANGYGIAQRKDGLGDVQFMANQVTAPGFDFLEVGDELRFDVAQVASGKWFAQRVVRM